MLSPSFQSSAKAQIADRFGRAAATYHELATIQKSGAKQLIAFTEADWFQLPEGGLLEIGCGTGFLTQELVQQFESRSIVVTDLSAAMLAFCQSQLSSQLKLTQVSFQQLDGELLSVPPEPYALIASGFALQWFDAPVQTIDRWLAAIKPGGWLLLSFPTDRSFPEWRQMCQEVGLPFTLNPLPNANALLEKLQGFPVRCFTREIISQTAHIDAIDFLKSLKAIGAGLSLTGKQLSMRQLKQLSFACKSQNQDTDHSKMIASHSIAYWAIQRTV